MDGNADEDKYIVERSHSAANDAGFEHLIDEEIVDDALKIVYQMNEEDKMQTKR